jgi:hypothetical protein
LGVLNTGIIKIHGDFCFTKRGSSGSVANDLYYTASISILHYTCCLPYFRGDLT